MSRVLTAASRPPHALPVLLVFLVLLLGLSGAGIPGAWAGEAPPTDPPAGVTASGGKGLPPPEPEAAIPIHRRIPAGVGWLLILLSVPPLFWGWKIIRLTMAAFCAVVFALIAYEAIAPSRGMGMAGGAALGGAVAGSIAGWYIRKPFAALEVAVVFGVIFALPGLFLDNELATVGLGLVGVVLGLALGWHAAFHLDAIDSSLVGGFLAAMGAMSVAQALEEDAVYLLGIGVLFVAAITGIVVQFRSVARAHGQGR
jgi:hypothetical protein